MTYWLTGLLTRVKSRDASASKKRNLSNLVNLHPPLVNVLVNLHRPHLLFRLLLLIRLHHHCPSHHLEKFRWKWDQTGNMKNKKNTKEKGFITSVFLTGGAGLGGRGHATGTPQPGFVSPCAPCEMIGLCTTKELVSRFSKLLGKFQPCSDLVLRLLVDSGLEVLQYALSSVKL